VTHSKERGFFFSCLLGDAWWLGSALVLLLISCSFLVLSPNPSALIFPIALAILYGSGIIGGFASVRLTKDGVLSGALSGVIAALFLMAVSFLPLYPSGVDIVTSVLCSLLLIPAFAVGSVIGHKREKTTLYSFKKKKRYS